MFQWSGFLVILLLAGAWTGCSEDGPTGPQGGGTSVISQDIGNTKLNVMQFNVPGALITALSRGRASLGFQR